jgi:hypothetical protein
LVCARGACRRAPAGTGGLPSGAASCATAAQTGTRSRPSR